MSTLIGGLVKFGAWEYRTTRMAGSFQGIVPSLVLQDVGAVILVAARALVGTSGAAGNRFPGLQAKTDDSAGYFWCTNTAQAPAQTLTYLWGWGLAPTTPSGLVVQIAIAPVVVYQPTGLEIPFSGAGFFDVNDLVSNVRFDYLVQRA